MIGGEYCEINRRGTSVKRIAGLIILLATLLAGACSAGGAGTASMTPSQATAATPAASPTAAPAARPPTVATPATAAVAKPANPDLILGTTTSTQDSGLLDMLIPLFEAKTGYKVKTIAVGSGQAMTMGERGEADVLLVHAPDSEKTFMAAGHGINRLLVMHNDFIIVGPASDPAKIKGLKTSKEAMRKIADAKSTFISRGDNSGTDQLEKKLWAASPKGQSWYQESGQGMGQTLNIASEKAAYTVADRATYLAYKKNVQLDILVEGDPSLLNVYHVIQVNPTKSDKINAVGARAFSDFMVNKDTQDTIAKFGLDKYGQALFFPDAGKTDAQLGL
ncbi:MAG: substrate-binding domain-containing protein [Dehalococcoidia bacterium]|nr:substrate-binding domain-containing protein [Dehalococcoidia bacterium]